MSTNSSNFDCSALSSSSVLESFVPVRAWIDCTGLKVEKLVLLRLKLELYEGPFMTCTKESEQRKKEKEREAAATQREILSFMSLALALFLMFQYVSSLWSKIVSITP